MDSYPIKVLIVEDNPDDSQAAGSFLRRYPYASFEVAVADRLSKAFAYLDKAPFDAILLDLNLPDSHGLETLGRARLHAYQCPIIVFSGNQARRLQNGAAEMGAFAYMTKDEGHYYALAESIHAMVSTRRSGAEFESARA